MKDFRLLLSTIVIVIVLSIFGVVARREVVSVFGSSMDIESENDLDEFLGWSDLGYGEIKDAYLIDSGWYIGTETTDKKESEIYIGKIGNKYYLATIDSKKEVDDETIEDESLLVTNYNKSDIKNYYEIRSGIADDLSDALGEQVMASDIADNMLKIENNKIKGKIIVIIACAVFAGCIIYIVNRIRKR